LVIGQNAILIVEFAKDLMEKEGKGIIEATLEASRMRLRPILMTSLAFILGVMPLVISTEPGAARKMPSVRALWAECCPQPSGDLLRARLLCGCPTTFYPS
jgi:hypothetical protein